MYARSRIAALGFGIGFILLAVGASAWGMDPVGSAKEAQKICGSGYFLILHPDGSKSCLPHLPPRSQADCPANAKFEVIKGEGECFPPLQGSQYPHAGDPPPATPCDYDSDCPTGFCNSGGFCPPNAQP